MADRLTAAERSVNMAKIRSGNTKPEMIVRRLLHAAGYRYRLHRKDLPGKPDLVFGPRRKVIFIHGCFWHQHDAPECLDGRKPKSNTEYWHAKLERNVERDQRHLDQLAAGGWETLVIWECQTKDPELLLRQIQAFLDPLPRTATAAVAQEDCSGCLPLGSRKSAGPRHDSHAQRLSAPRQSLPRH